MASENVKEKKRIFAVVGKNIVKTIANKTILDDVNISVQKRSIYALLGINGAGKSVLLNCLMGILKINSGEVIISDDFPDTTESIGSDFSFSSGVRNGSYVRSGSGISSSSDVSGNNIVVTIRPTIGYAPQNFDVPGPMEVYQLLNFACRVVNGLPKDQFVERYEILAIMVGLPVTNYLVSKLSYSQKKALSLVLAVIHEPELIILDDITTGMDTMTLKNIWKLLSFINETKQCTIIVSASNNFCFMKTIVTHIGILVDGKIVEDTTENIMKRYEVSSIDDLLIKVVFTGDDQIIDYSGKIGRLHSIKSTIKDEDTSPLNSIFITQVNVPENRESVLAVLQALTLKNIWTLARINLMTYSFFAVLLPLIVHLMFGAYSSYPLFGICVKVYSQEGQYDVDDHTIETMSYAFVHNYLNKSFELTYGDTENIREGDCELLLHFNQNYTTALRRRIERKVKNNADFENSQIIIKFDMTDGQRAAYVKEKLYEHYTQFLSDYAHNMFTEYVTDINYDSIRFTYTTAQNVNDYPIYARYVNSGLIVFLAFFFHASMSVWLLLPEADDRYRWEEWKLYLSRLVVQLPMAIVYNALIVTLVYVLYDIGTYCGYAFLGLLLESICGIHFGYVLCSLVKKRFKVSVLLYLSLTICVYISGFWWPTNAFSGWRQDKFRYFPISTGSHFIRNLVSKNYFDVKLLLILSGWTVIFVTITVIDIIGMEYGKRYNKLKN